jgi:hypothetical protein
MPVFPCHDCAELHNRKTKISNYTGYGTCACLCPGCGNNGRQVCEECGGSGKSGWLGRKCKVCEGEKSVICGACKGFLADPKCPVCRGTSCETCFGSRMADLERVFTKLKTSPRRRIVFQPTGSLSRTREMDFPGFSYENAWKRLEPLLDLDPQLTVCRESDAQSVHLAGKLDGEERSYYAIFRFGEDEYGIEETFSNLESSGVRPLLPDEVMTFMSRTHDELDSNHADDPESLRQICKEILKEEC